MLWGADRRGFSEFRFLDMCGVTLSVWISSWGEGLHWRGAFSSHRVLTSGVGWMVSCQVGNELLSLNSLDDQGWNNQIFGHQDAKRNLRALEFDVSLLCSLCSVCELDQSVEAGVLWELEFQVPKEN